MTPAPEPFGIYVHVPFSASRCDYCAFATWTDRHHLAAAYAAALVGAAGRAPLRPATSVFFGGGTPSQLAPELFAAVLSALPLAPEAEVTAECNPDDASPELFAAWRGAGVTRVSLGVQSTSAHVLRALGRRHDPAAVTRAVGLVRDAGFATFNLDVIMGAAGETDADWRRTLEDVLALEPPHVSAYALTVEPGTPLARTPELHPDDDAQADRYLVADRVLHDAGLEWYEISNWARPGHECAHNLLTWAQGDYLGLGCAAHSHVGGRRWWNVRTPDRYIELVAAGRDTTAGEEVLDAGAVAREALELALRTRAGVPLDALDTDDAALHGLVAPAADRWVLTPTGRLLANEVAIRLRTAGPVSAEAAPAS